MGKHLTRNGVYSISLRQDIVTGKPMMSVFERQGINRRTGLPAWQLVFNETFESEDLAQERAHELIERLEKI